MKMIRLATWIDAPVERCFLLSLNVDLHIASAGSTRERAIDGVTSGLIREGETVTFEGWHFGRRWSHTSLIDLMRLYSYYRDVMTAGVFEHFEHDHHFAVMDDGTRMRDEIRFSAPGGILGRLAETFVRRHLIAFLEERNAMIKRVAESQEWRRYLEDGVVSRVEAPAPAKTETPRRWDGNALLPTSPRIAVTRRNS